MSSKPTKIEKEEMEDDLEALERIIAEAKREAAKIRQRLDDVVEPGDAPVNNLPAPEPNSMLAKALAKIDRAIIDRGLSYLDKALTVERLLNRKT